MDTHSSCFLFHRIFFLCKIASIFYKELLVFHGEQLQNYHNFRLLFNIKLEKSHVFADNFMNKLHPCSCLWDDNIH